MGEVISVFEYDLLGSGKAASIGAKLVPQQVFNYLEALSPDESPNDFGKNH
ncbi:hypothetical protein [Klebsiella pneumoniae]